MKVAVKIGAYQADLGNPLDISIPVSFGKEQLSAFGGAPAQKKTYKAGHFTGDVRRGGSCNCETYSFSPHLNGTHTECVGHITKERISVQGVGLAAAVVVTVAPKQGVITNAMLKSVKPAEALVIRTLPNAKSKMTRNYNKSMPPYFTPDAMRHIVKLGVQHLLVDFPSVDRMDDAKLTNHRIFWAKNPSKKTITELVYVPSKVKDGNYLLNLQVAAFEGDAAPSRPVLYRVRK